METESSGGPADQMSGFWPRDAVHFPRVLSPLGASIVPALEYDGVEAASSELALPVRILARVVDGFVYNSIRPRGRSATEQAALERRHAVVMANQIAHLPQRWRTEYLPEIDQNNRRLLAFDLHAADGPGLLAHLEDALQTLARHWQIHFLVVLPVFAAGGALVRAYEALFGSGDERAPYRLLQGFENRTLAADNALWELSRQASASPALAAAVHDGVVDLSKLRDIPGGERFLIALATFLSTHGQRTASADDLNDPTWAEDPHFPIRAIAGYLTTGGDSPETRRRQQAVNREAETARLLSGLDEGASDPFLHALREAQAVWPLREDHTHLIDQPSFAILRRIALEAGERLVAGQLLDQREDIFMLTREEAVESMQAGTARQALVARRRQEYEQRLRSIPPAFLGTPPPADAPPPDPELLKFFGRPPDPERDQSILNGIAASPGRARGAARIVRSPEDFASVQPGDILVCASTTPPWTPLFGLVAGVVTDAGGILSHGAIVAREYGLPAVTGTGNGTARIRQGQVVEVDGDAGTVHLAPR